MNLSRDLALILLTAVIVVVAMVCATVLVVAGEADAQAGYALLTAGVGIGGVAIGRLTGTNVPAPPAG